MAIATFQLRNDLLVSRHGRADGSFFVIKDPATDRFFRFGETEHFIAQQFDGATPVETVRQRVEERFGATLTPEMLERFIERLRGLGLLTGEQAQTRQRPGRRRRIAGDLFCLRFKAIDPDRLLERMAPALRFLFTPTFVASSAAFILCAVGITIGHWGEMMRELRELLRFESLVVAWGICFVVIVAHEFAHGLTCKHFGGKVREMGFLLLYFQPAFFCNVSDAWLFPSKAHRLWVTFAGAYFELFIWALATVVWRVTDLGTTFNYLAVVVVATSGIKTFFNLNPLIKLDGYYLLSDALDVPNLRRKAFAWLRGRLKNLLTFTGPPSDGPTARERRIYLVYGLLAGVYSFWLLGFVASRAGSFLVERYQGWGFALFAILLFGIFRHPIRRAAAGLSSELSLVREKRVRTLKRVGRAVVVLAGLGAALWFWRPQLKVAGEFTILPIHNADVRAEVEGTLQEILRDEGDWVRRGEVLARLADRDCAAELRKISAEIEEKQARLKLLRAGPRSEEIDLARTTVAKAEERLKFSQQQRERDRALFDQRLLSRRDDEAAEEQSSVRRKELEEAQNQLKVLLAGSRPEAIESLEAELRRVVAQQRYLDEQLRLHTVPSPADGVVTTHKLKEKVGQHVKKGDLIAEVHELKTVTAEIAVPEKEIADVEVGRKVVLKCRAHPGRDFQGTVVAIAPVATKPDESRLSRTVLVTTQLDNASLLLKPEMSGMAKIYCGERSALDLLTRRFVRYFRVEVWSWW
ncbi:MAG TPA: efflux RND transporter periplasmic adaptor subunit [Verrucomicrobiae bacterium]|nr:efflux RND transporter periplasmic adaptor subunit [Verrucomicrobiae bacterium]